MFNFKYHLNNDGANNWHAPIVSICAGCFSFFAGVHKTSVTIVMAICGAPKCLPGPSKCFLGPSKELLDAYNTS